MKPKQNKTKLASATYLRSSPPAMTIHSEYPLGLKAASIASPCSWPCVSTGWQYSLITSLIRGSPMAWWDTTVAHSEVSSKLILHLYVYSRLSKPQLSHIKVVISSSSRTGMSLKPFRRVFMVNDCVWGSLAHTQLNCPCLQVEEMYQVRLKETKCVCFSHYTHSTHQYTQLSMLSVVRCWKQEPLCSEILCCHLMFSQI